MLKLFKTILQKNRADVIFASFENINVVPTDVEWLKSNLRNSENIFHTF